MEDVLSSPTNLRYRGSLQHEETDEIELGIRLYKDKIEFDLEPVGSADPIETYSEKVSESEFTLIQDWLEEFEGENIPCPGLFGEWSKDTLLKALEGLKGWKEEGIA